MVNYLIGTNILIISCGVCLLPVIVLLFVPPLISPPTIASPKNKDNKQDTDDNADSHSIKEINDTYKQNLLSSQYTDLALLNLSRNADFSSCPEEHPY